MYCVCFFISVSIEIIFYEHIWLSTPKIKMSRPHKCRQDIYGTKKRQHPHNFVRLALFVPKKAQKSCRGTPHRFFLMQSNRFFRKGRRCMSVTTFFFAKTTSPKVILDKNKNVQIQKVGVLFSNKKCSLWKISWISWIFSKNTLYLFIFSG